jgi:hypothetical protein
LHLSLDVERKPIRLSRHALQQLEFRGATRAEVAEAIWNTVWEPAHQGRWECRKDYPFHREWNGIFYETKQVRPIFVDEAAEIVVVTVYVYYVRGGSS